MKRLLLAAVALLCATASAQTINPNQIRPSSTNGQVIITEGGISQWGNSSGAALFPGTNGIVFNTSTTASRNALFSDIVPLWAAGSCSGYLKSDGTCGSGGSSSSGPAGTIQSADGSGGFSAATSTNIQNGIGTGVYVSSTGANNGPIFLFGTSVTEGVGSYVNGNSYADILATDSANGLQNWGRGGDQAADMVLQVFRKYPKNSTARPSLVLFDPFINDANHCGNTTGCLANAAEALSAAIAWTTIPSSYYTYATAATSSGFSAVANLFGDATMPVIAMSTTTQNATLTFSLTNAGSEVGLTFQACDAYTTATFTVTLGGTLVDTISPIGNNGQTILTQNGESCTLFRKEYANSHGATVSLVIQKTDATTGTAGTVTIAALDTNPTGAGTGAPVAFTEGTIMQNNNANSAATAAFDAQANTTATQFATDGWNSYYVPLRAGQTGANPGVNSTTDMANNPPVNPNENVGLHPNSGPGGGHYHLAQTIENFALAQGFQFFNVGLSGGHNFFYSPLQQFQHFAPTNALGYNNFNADGVLSTTALNPGGLLVNGYVSPTGSGTFGGLDFGYDSSIPSYMTRVFGPGYVEICPLNAGVIPKQQSDFGCGHDIWWSNGDYVKPSGFFRPKGGISYENQFSTNGVSNAFNSDRARNVNFVNTSAGATYWMLPLCKANTYDYQMWYYKSTGDTNPIVFNAYNTLDSINGNTSTVTGTITAYSINASNVITLTAANSLTVGQAVTLSGFGTSTFLNGVVGTVTSATSTTFTFAYAHSAQSATENGAFGVNASWSGLASPYSAAVAQCSVGPTGVNTISIAQFAGGGTGIAPAVAGDLLKADTNGNPSDSGIAASNVPLLNANSNVYAVGTSQYFQNVEVFSTLSMTSAQATSSSGNLSPAPYQSTGSFWNGSAPISDDWSAGTVLGTGTAPTSTYVISHTGTTGAVSESFPGPISAPAIAQSYINNSSTTVSGIKNISGSSNFASGTATIAFPGGTFANNPACTATLVDGGAPPGTAFPTVAFSNKSATGFTLVASDASSTLGFGWTCTGN